MIDSSPKSVAQSRQEQTPNPAQDEHIQHGITYLRQLLSESAFKDGMIKASTAPIRREEDALHVQLKQKMIDEATHSSSLAQLKASTAQQTLLVDETIDRWTKEITTFQNDSNFRDAMSAWGSSPNKSMQRGEDGTGFHAGIVHYFEYRSDTQKNSRYKGETLDTVGIPSFIDFTRKMQSMLGVLGGEPTQNSEFVRAVVLLGSPDSEGFRQRRIIAQSTQETIISFQDTWDDLPRIVTVIPSEPTVESFNKSVQSALNPEAEAKRLNSLRGEITILYGINYQHNALLS